MLNTSLFTLRSFGGRGSMRPTMAAKLGFYKHFGSTEKGNLDAEKQQKPRKRDRFKTFFSRWVHKNSGSLSESSTLICSSEQSSVCSSLQNSVSIVEECMGQTEAYLSDPEARIKISQSSSYYSGDYDNFSVVSILPRKQEPLKIVKERIMNRLNRRSLEDPLNQRRYVSNEINTELSRVIAKCLREDVSSASFSSVYSEHLTIPSEKSIHSTVCSNGTGQTFKPLYEHSFELASPPKTLPKEKYGKWERKQMIIHATKRGSSNLGRSQHFNDLKNSPTGTDSIPKSSYDQLNASKSFIGNISKLFSLNNSQTGSNANVSVNKTPFSTSNFSNFSSLFLFKSPTTAEVGEQSETSCEMESAEASSISTITIPQPKPIKKARTYTWNNFEKLKSIPQLQDFSIRSSEIHKAFKETTWDCYM